MDILLGLLVVAWMTHVAVQAIRITPAPEPDPVSSADPVVGSDLAR